MAARAELWAEEFPDVPAELASFRPGAAVVLGSGLGGFADSCRKLFEVPYGAVEGLPRSAVPGHAGKFIGADFDGTPLLLALGRAHCYEGHSARRAAAHVRFMAGLDPGFLLLTNAAGTLNPEFAPGSWMMLRDHLNMLGQSPLEGGPNFIDMSAVYDPGLREAFRATAAAEGVPLSEGVYACMPGPQYETPAEVKMMRILGADAVGMSTVPEAIQARALGLRVAAFSCLTNWAAGVTGQHLSHAEVIETGRVAAADFLRLLGAALRGGIVRA